MMANIATNLFNNISKLIESAKTRVSREFNLTLIMLNWHISDRINKEVLKNERANYRRQLKELTLVLVTWFMIIESDKNSVQFIINRCNIITGLIQQSNYTPIPQRCAIIGAIEFALKGIFQTLTCDQSQNEQYLSDDLREKFTLLLKSIDFSTQWKTISMFWKHWTCMGILIYREPDAVVLQVRFWGGGLPK